MNNLDDKILELFRYLINSGTKYLTSINYSNHKFCYEVNGKVVNIKVVTVNEKDEQKPNSYTNIKTLLQCGWGYSMLHGWAISKIEESKIGYTLSIDDKCYIVPTLQRQEHAHILDRIEDVIAQRESETLDSVIGKLTEDSREEL